jgi:hypothetical protein
VFNPIKSEESISVPSNKLATFIILQRENALLSLLLCPRFESAKCGKGLVFCGQKIDRVEGQRIVIKSNELATV